MSLDKVAKIKIGIGVVLIGLTALTVSFILKNVRKLANLTFDIRTIKVNTLNLKETEYYQKKKHIT